MQKEDPSPNIKPLLFELVCLRGSAHYHLKDLQQALQDGIKATTINSDEVKVRWIEQSSTFPWWRVNVRRNVTVFCNIYKKLLYCIFSLFVIALTGLCLVSFLLQGATTTQWTVICIERVSNTRARQFGRAVDIPQRSHQSRGGFAR